MPSPAVTEDPSLAAANATRETRSAYTSLPQTLAHIDGGIEQESMPALAQAVHWRGGADLPIHRWYRYREGFSPTIVSQLRLGKQLLDPFCGCGSTMVAAALTGRKSTGLDINPLALFAANVKLRPLTKSQLAGVQEFHRATTSQERLAEPTWASPPLKIAPKLFEPEILATLSEIRTAIQKQPDQAVRDFLLLAWLAILEKVGSYFKEGNGIKYRNKKRLKTGYITRTNGEWQLRRFGTNQRAFVRRVFSQHLGMMIQDVKYWERGCWSDQRVLDANAMQLTAAIGSDRYTSVVFSPPYANRFDYFESMKVELWFGQFIRSYEELDALRKQSLRSHLGANLKRSRATVPAVESLISHMDTSASSWKMGVPEALRGYFDDMFRVLKQCRSAIARRGRCCVVVGNSAYAGVVIPTDSILASLGLEAGFANARVHVVRHLTVSSQQRNALVGLESYMRESVVIFR